MFTQGNLSYALHRLGGRKQSKGCHLGSQGYDGERKQKRWLRRNSKGPPTDTALGFSGDRSLPLGTGTVAWA